MRDANAKATDSGMTLKSAIGQQELTVAEFLALPKAPENPSGFPPISARIEGGQYFIAEGRRWEVKLIDGKLHREWVA